MLLPSPSWAKSKAFGFFVWPESAYPSITAAWNLRISHGYDRVHVAGEQGRVMDYSLFAQDTWKVSRHITLTSGLRWEINTPPASVTSGKPLFSVAGIFDPRPVGLVATPLWQTGFHNLAQHVGAAALTPTA